MDNYVNKGSGWNLDEVVYADIHIGKYNTLPAAAYIELPRNLRNKKAIVNIKMTTTTASCGVFLPSYILLQRIRREYRNTKDMCASIMDDQCSND